VVGSATTPDEHLVITASPTPLLNDAKVVNGPAWYANARVKPMGHMTINGLPMHAVYVTPAMNEGSVFMDHIVLIWSHGGHTYGLGFHKTGGLMRTLLLDEELARSIRLVAP